MNDFKTKIKVLEKDEKKVTRHELNGNISLKITCPKCKSGMITSCNFDLKTNICQGCNYTFGPTSS